MFKAEVVLHSKNAVTGKEIATVKLVMPRIVLAELNTHRVFTRNSASSRAIPYHKMVREVLERPFIPLGFQKNHSGMQGTEYFDADERIDIYDFAATLNNIFRGRIDEPDYLYFQEALNQLSGHGKMTPTEWWLLARDKAVESSMMLAAIGVTKQLCNRILEPFMWHTVLVTATEWENFFDLRCPSYKYTDKSGDHSSRFTSRKLWQEARSWCIDSEGNDWSCPVEKPVTDLDWLRINQSGAEIHISRIAELLQDELRASKPQILEPGEWHIPFGDRMDTFELEKLMPEIQPSSVGWYEKQLLDLKLKVSTSRSARISYETLGDNPVIDHKKDVMLADDLFQNRHMSPFEHCAMATWEEDAEKWSGNFRGFVQYRQVVENKLQKV